MVGPDQIDMLPSERREVLPNAVFHLLTLLKQFRLCPIKVACVSDNDGIVRLERARLFAWLHNRGKRVPWDCSGRVPDEPTTGTGHRGSSSVSPVSRDYDAHHHRENFGSQMPKQKPGPSAPPAQSASSRGSTT